MFPIFKWPLHWCDVALCNVINPNTTKSHQISQKLSPKHAARGVAQSPYPIYRHGKACLSKQPSWHAAGDPRLACGWSRVQALARRARCEHFFLHLPFLPPLGDSFFAPSTKPTKVLGLRLNNHINQVHVMPIFYVLIVNQRAHICNAIKQHESRSCA